MYQGGFCALFGYMSVYIQQVPNMSLNEAVAAELQRVRRSLDLTQADLAELSGIPRVTIQRYETGGTIKVPELERLCLAMGDDPLDFFARASAQRHGED